MHASLVTRGLSRRFGRRDALLPLDLELTPGVTALVGPNGAGKTTLLSVLFGLLPPTSGEARVLGLDPRRQRPELRLRASLVPDEPKLTAVLRVRQVVDFFATLHPRWNSSECSRLIERFGLPLKSRVSDLSRGEAGQLAFVVGAATQPEVLALDEPTSGLDPMVRRSLLDALREIASEEGRTVLISTHVMKDVDAVADRVLVLDRGALVADGSPAVLGACFVRVSLLFDGELPATVDGALRVFRGGREIVATFSADRAPDAGELALRVGAREARILGADFDETFALLIEGARA